MNKVVKVIIVLLLVVFVAVAALLSYVKFALPNVPLQDDLVIEQTPERIARGAYLANNVMGCLDCHAQRDMTKYAGPFYPEKRGLGGERWSENEGINGLLVSPNITPAHLGDWTDAEIYRAITSGVSKDGRALFPIMPYVMYGRLPKEDIYSVIAYIRTLEPRPSTTPPTSLGFPLNFVVNTIPDLPKHDLKPDPANSIRHGEYMITASVCNDCHTPMKNGQFIMEKQYSGGTEFKLPTGGVVRSANLTPDKDTGIGSWTKETFIQKFKTFSDSTFVAYEVGHNQFNTFMPWTYYARMSEDDLGAIYDYLMSLKPIRNQVVRFTPAGM